MVLPGKSLKAHFAGCPKLAENRYKPEIISALSGQRIPAVFIAGTLPFQKAISFSFRALNHTVFYPEFRKIKSLPVKEGFLNKVRSQVISSRAFRRR